MVNRQPARKKRKISSLIDGILRRLNDLFISGFLILLLFPLYLSIALLIRRDSPGPVIHKERRIGKGGRVFLIHKFRIARVDTAPEGEAKGKVQRSKQPVTSFGRFLNETKLEEIPQLWNVFIGDMSLVGPRADNVKAVNEWPVNVREEILSVRPGLTSPASVMYTYFDNLLQSQNVFERSLFDILPTKQRLDQLYLRWRNIMTDLDVLSWTVLALLPRLRSITFPENLTPSGMLRHFFSGHVFGFITDLLVSFIVVAIAGRLIPTDLVRYSDVPGLLGMYLIIALIFSLANLLNGSHRVRWDQASAGDSLDLAISTSIATLLISIANLLVPGDTLVAPAFLMLSGLLAFVGFICLRYRERLIAALAAGWMRLRGHGLARYGEPVLIVGGGDTGRYCIGLLRDGPLAQAFNVVGIIDDDPGKQGSVIEGVEVIGATRDLPALSRSADIGMVFFAISEIDPGESRRIAGLCRNCGVRMIAVPDMMSQLRNYFPKDEGGQVELIGAVLQDSTHDRLTGAYNRQSFIRHLERESIRCQVNGQPCSLLVFEVNYQWPDGAVRSRAFTGQVLQVVAERTLKSVRNLDIFGRCGESEFALLLPQTDSLTASRLAERLQKQLVNAPIWTDRGPLNISLFSAVVSLPASGASAETLIEEAQIIIQREKSIETPVEANGLGVDSTRAFRLDRGSL